MMERSLGGRRRGYAVVLWGFLCLSLAACGSDGGGGDGDGESGGDGAGSTAGLNGSDADNGTNGAGMVDPEAAAGLSLVAIYAGTYEVEATLGSHARGTVTISQDGATFDFDEGRSFTLEGENVYNRIPNFPTEPRVQIEIPGTPQQRLRIYVDIANPTRALRFTYDEDADDETQTVEVTVNTGNDAGNGGSAGDGGGSAGDGGSQGQSIPAGQFGAAFEASGMKVSASGEPAIAITGLGDERFLELRGGGIVSDGARLRMLPIGKTGSYECGKGPNEYRLVEMIVRVDDVEYRADAMNGGTCQIDVTAAGSDYEGTFSGKLKSQDGKTVDVSAGAFRIDGSML